MPKALVTGTTGLVGGAIARRLLGEGWEVTSLARSTFDVLPGVTSLICDLLAPNLIEETIQAQTNHFDAVFHAAAAMPANGITDSRTLFQVNANATAALAELHRRGHWGAFIYISGITVIGPPQTNAAITEETPCAPECPYTASKLAGELACRSVLPNAVILRISSPYGRNMRNRTVLPLFASLAARHAPVHWHGNGTRAQDFIHIDDVANACLRAATIGKFGIFNIASGAAISMRELAELATKLAESPVPPLSSGQADPEEGRSWNISNTKAREQLGFVPRIHLTEGLATIIADMRQSQNNST